ncbi:hypothetical protein Syun_001297 [Stephania yunnanensis]|uniref:Uncharacterized protein n=1 Tax=Stephania yunnanensis TaxID=152371 RepID=A0AAP0LF90_9MAGN
MSGSIVGDELLLQEDVSDTSSLTSDFANGMCLGHSLNSGVATAGVARQYRASYSVHSGYHPSSQSFDDDPDR